MFIMIGLNEFIEKLDERYNAHHQNDAVMAKKPRVIGIPSTCSVPANAPTWSVDKNYIQTQ